MGPVQGPPKGMGEIEILLGPGNAHVTEPPLFLHAFSLADASAVGKEAILHTHHENRMEL